MLTKKLLAFSTVTFWDVLTSPLLIERTSKRDVFLNGGVQQPWLLRCIGHRVPVFTEPWQGEKERKKERTDKLGMWINTLSLPSQQTLMFLLWNEGKTWLMMRLKLQSKCREPFTVRADVCFITFSPVLS